MRSSDCESDGGGWCGSRHGSKIPQVEQTSLIFPDNRRSIAVASRLGAHFEKSMPFRGQTCRTDERSPKGSEPTAKGNVAGKHRIIRPMEWSRDEQTNAYYQGGCAGRSGVLSYFSMGKDQQLFRNGDSIR
jgi:hypothetical protein